MYNPRVYESVRLCKLRGSRGPTGFWLFAALLEQAQSLSSSHLSATSALRWRRTQVVDNLGLMVLKTPTLTSEC